MKPPPQEREGPVTDGSRDAADRPNPVALARHGAPMRLEAARAAYGILLLVVPDRLAGLAGEVLTPRERFVVRVLGTRQLLQAALLRDGAEPGHRRAHTVGGAVDLAHACTMFALALSCHRLRQLAGLEAVVASMWSATELLTADRSRRAGAGHGVVEAAALPGSAGASAVAEPADRHDPVRSRRRAAAALQEVIVDLAVESRGRPVHEVLAALRAEIVARDLPAQPEPWLQAVAGEAAAGRLYVVGKQAARDVGIAVPPA